MITISRLYDNYEDANVAVNALVRDGVPRDDVSIVASNAEGWYRNDVGVSNTRVGADAGAVIGGALGLLAGVGLLAIPGIGPVVAAGWAATTLAGAVAGGIAGGIIGALTEAGVSERDAPLYAEGVRRGGTVVIARVPDAEAARYEAILDTASIDLRERSAMWQRNGWTGYDPNAAAYTPEEARRERELYRQDRY